MRPYIYGEKNGVHIIDLQKTAVQLNDALRFIRRQLLVARAYFLSEPSVQLVRSSEQAGALECSM